MSLLIPLQSLLSASLAQFLPGVVPEFARKLHVLGIGWHQAPGLEIGHIHAVLDKEPVEEPSVKTSVVDDHNPIIDESRNFRSDFAECGRIGNHLVIDAVNEFRLKWHMESRINQAIEQGRAIGIKDRDLARASKSMGIFARRFQVQDNESRFEQVVRCFWKRSIDKLAHAR